MRVVAVVEPPLELFDVAVHVLDAPTPADAEITYCEQYNRRGFRTGSGSPAQGSGLVSAGGFVLNALANILRRIGTSATPRKYWKRPRIPALSRSCARLASQYFCVGRDPEGCRERRQPTPE